MNGDLKVIWVNCSKETAHARMQERNSQRDTWKLAHWDAYVLQENFNAPDIDELLVYHNETDAQEAESFAKLLEHLR